MAKKTEKKMIPFVSKGKGTATPQDGTIADHGKIGSLSYEVYTRGVLHIKDNKGLVFKKDPEIFEEELEKIDFGKVSEGQELVIVGSGDNDDLILTVKDDEIQLSLRKKEFSIVRKLRDLISLGKKNKAQQA